MVVDGLCEAEYHRPDYGDNVSSFMVRHVRWKLSSLSGLDCRISPSSCHTLRSRNFIRHLKMNSISI
jgi:hypothetical protein